MFATLRGTLRTPSEAGDGIVVHQNFPPLKCLTVCTFSLFFLFFFRSLKVPADASSTHTSTNRPLKASTRLCSCALSDLRWSLHAQHMLDIFHILFHSSKSFFVFFFLISTREAMKIDGNIFARVKQSADGRCITNCSRSAGGVCWNNHFDARIRFHVKSYQANLNCKRLAEFPWKNVMQSAGEREADASLCAGWWKGARANSHPRQPSDCYANWFNW